MIIHSHTKNQVNISSHSKKKVVTTKYLAKFQSPTAVSLQNVIQPDWISKVICNLWLYTLVQKVKSISPSIAKKVVTTKYLAKFQSPRAIARPKIIGPERNANLICKLITMHPHTKYQVNISKHSEIKWWQLFYFGITEMGKTIYVAATEWRGQKKNKCSSFTFNIYKATGSSGRQVMIMYDLLGNAS